MIIRIDRKYFSNDDYYYEGGEDSRGGAGKTLAKVGAGLAAAGGLFYGARKGLLGSRMQMKSNIAWGNLGRRFGSDSMMKSGAAGYGEGVASNLASKSGIKDLYNKIDSSGGKYNKFLEKHSKNASDEALRLLKSGKNVNYSRANRVNAISEKLGKQGADITDAASALKAKQGYYNDKKNVFSRYLNMN